MLDAIYCLFKWQVQKSQDEKVMRENQGDRFTFAAEACVSDTDTMIS